MSRFWKESKGLTLIEVVVAILIAVIFLLSLCSAILIGQNSASYTRERMFLAVATRSILDQIGSYSLDSIAAMNGRQFEITVGGVKVVPGYIQMNTTRPYRGTSDLVLVTMTHYPGGSSPNEVVVNRVFGDVVPKAGDVPHPPDLPPMADFKG
ncbi:MAG: prepilin-type N-terminal cleavage/methylation domain-containing protein, partial [Planctomycetota bacterium]|nr:prepilin-type N-terminal cleavage/methylation domain-containing protein [Planctomycetota bacterium]